MLPWLIHHVRVTAFSLDPDTVPKDQQEGLFKVLFDADADVDEKRATMRMRRRQLTVGNRSHELIEQPRRIDVTWSSLPALQMQMSEPLTEQSCIGPLLDIDEFHSSALKVYGRCSNVVRVALGTLLYIPTQDAAEAYEKIGSLIPTFGLVYGKHTDFQLQVNRPVSLPIAGSNLTINRLGVLGAVRATLMVGGADIDPTGAAGNHWAQLAIDVNTDGHNTTSFDPKNYAELQEILISQVKALAGGQYD